MATKYTISIADQDCVGDGLCCEHAGATFHLCEAGTSSLVEPASGSDASEQVLAAAYDCRMGCISLSAADSGDRVWPAALSAQTLERLNACRAVTLDRDEWSLWRDHGGGD